jgi:YD repeat-containing protein
MKNKIKSIHIFRNDFIIKSINDEEIDMQEFLQEYAELDDQGNEALKINYAADSVVQDRSERSFDGEGKLISQKYFDGEDIAEHLSYEWNPEGKLAKEFLHYLDGSKDTITFTYDRDGNLISKTTTDDEGFEEKKETFAYANKQRIKYESFEDGELIKEESNQLDADGNVIENTVRDMEQEENYRLVHEYENKQRVKTLRYNDNGDLVEKEAFRYEDDKMVFIQHETPKTKSITQITYDKNNNLVKQEEFADGEILNNSIEREFNENGNVLQSRVYLNLHGQGVDRHYILRYEYEYFS